MSERDDELEGLPLGELPALEPPAGFADDVMKVWASEAQVAHAPVRTPRAARVQVLRPAMAAAAVAAIAVFAVDRLPEGASEGSLLTSSREEVAVGDRATVVAEAGVDLSWRVQTGGDTVVEQRRGTAFYRVEPGGSFLVKTPAGEARVTGTCFTVELRTVESIDMSNRSSQNSTSAKKANLLSAVGGAALATTLLLTVHEGSVSLHNEAGDLPAVVAGEVAQATATGGPKKLSADERARALLEENRLLAAERRALRAQTAELEGQLKRVMLARANGEDPLAAENRELKEQLDGLRADLDLAEGERDDAEGKAVAFPEDLAPEYREAALKEAFLDMFGKLGAPGDVVGIDCSEYPCIVFGELNTSGARAETDEVWQRFDRLMREHYPDATNNHSISNSRHRNAETGETKSMFGISFQPKEGGLEGDERKNMNKRVRDRNQQFFEATWATP